jgi:hypothetical protein
MSTSTKKKKKKKKKFQEKKPLLKTIIKTRGALYCLIRPFSFSIFVFLVVNRTKRKATKKRRRKSNPI